MSRIAQAYNRFCYKAETQYLLNHLTLSVRDPAIKKEVLKYQLKQIKNLIVPMHIIAVLMIITNFFQFFVKGEGHPLMLILSVVNLLFLPALCVLDFVKRKWGLNTHVILLYCYFFMHSTGAALVYYDQLPAWLQGRKNIFDMQIVLSYTTIMAIPIHSYWQGFVLMTPILLVTEFFKSLGEFDTLEKFRDHLPEELQNEIESRD